MRKFSFLVAISLLALWTGGCGSDSGSNQASPTPSPAPSGASPSPVPGATGSPSATPSPTFASPLVTPKSNGTTAATGLIQSTNPDERARQAQSGAGQKNGSQLPSPPILQAPSQTDPFAVLPPQTVQNLPVPTQGVNGASTGSSLPKLPDREVPLLPALPVSTRPPQIGGAKLTGANAGPIRLSPLAQSVVNEFSTFDSLLDDSTKYSDYTQDLGILRDIIYGDQEDGRNSTRRQLLLTNRPLFRRLEKALGEYEYAQKLWNLYGSQSPTDAIRCSVVGDIEQAIQIYRPQTERRGELSCARRLNMLQAVWRQGKLIVDAARRDQDYQGPTIARSPVLPVLSQSQPLTSERTQEQALGRQIASLPQVPIQTPPQLSARSPGIPLLPGGSGIGTSTVPQLPGGINPPRLGIGGRPLGPIGSPPPLPVAARPLGVPDLPELPVDKRPPQWVDPNPPRQRPGPAIPPPPDTGIASGIEVSGVVKVGNEIQVIVKVPTEATSRYVKVGQRLANGQVLVKRVDIRPGQDPIVILEQSGVEISRVVGEKPVNSPGNSTNTIVRNPGNNNRATRR